MKINFILPFKRMTGGIRVVYIYANYLVEQGHDVTCYVPMISYKGKGQSALYRLKASLGNTIKKEQWFDRKFSIQLVPYINEKFIRDADVSVATAWQTAYDVARFSEKKGRKYYFIQGYEIFNGDKNRVEASYELPLHLITVTKGLKKTISQFTSKDIDIVYNGLADDEYIKGDKSLEATPSVVMMYHESEHKRTQDGLKIIKKLKERYPSLKVNIFGRRIPEKLPNAYHVAVNPERFVILEMYRKSDIYLFTSDIESWGLPIVEAMANKCVVVGRKLGALSELGNETNAVIVEHLEDIEEAVSSLLEDRDKLKKIQEKAYQTVQPLHWKNSCRKFEELLLED
ncbi:glycosyltransferase family 4 protein [Streptococcus sciuri]|uniref:Glycosyltransferase family 4 protein n=1 Tax=Streptococcus sciuri TaxID=2973939 RepID=A0ABT2F5G3_9STRE|nr:glycosyltransferase family 4 protein [Streptococcus sciuri]MCS4487689.1 glycosyltransferase family 4 protein [Streptococcus sciuri]